MFFAPVAFIFTLLTLATSQMAQARTFEEAKSIEDRVSDFVGDSSFYQSLDSLELLLGNAGQTANQPWSGSYWPLYSGSIAVPYAEDRLASGDFTENRDHFKERMGELQAMQGKLTPQVIRDLSPSEKYDLYLGDLDFSLTQAVWRSIGEHNRRAGGIQTWEGSCHGWAPAAAYMPRPAHPILMPSVDSKYLIPFYPDDLKALSTLLWGNSLIQDYTLIEGIRCKTQTPKKDADSGRVMETSCKGVNPGVWHLAILGLVGAQKTSFIINRQNSTQVWNQPVANYRFSYVNVNTDKTGTLKESMLPLAEVKDKLSAFRAPGTKFIVGVRMNIGYASESGMSHTDLDTEANDTIAHMSFAYDLELNAAHEVLGGEWKWNNSSTPQYPGFIWKFQTLSPRAEAVIDPKVPAVNSADYTSEKLIPLSKKAAQYNYEHFRTDSEGERVLSYREARPQPLGRVVNYLMKLSHNPVFPAGPVPTATPEPTPAATPDPVVVGTPSAATPAPVPSATPATGAAGSLPASNPVPTATPTPASANSNPITPAPAAVAVPAPAPTPSASSAAATPATAVVPSAPAVTPASSAASSATPASIPVSPAPTPANSVPASATPRAAAPSATPSTLAPVGGAPVVPVTPSSGATVVL